MNSGLGPWSSFVRLAAPSAISAFRVVLAFVLIQLLIMRPHWAPVLAIGILFVFLLDAVDGIVARRLESQSLLGSFVDIVADRLVEFCFFSHFVGLGLVPFWFIAMFYGRILVTDACRVRAFRMKRVSPAGITLSPFGQAAVLSKWSRSSYALLKALLFCLLTVQTSNFSAVPGAVSRVTLVAVLTFSLVRALPIVVMYGPWLRRTPAVDVEQPRFGEPFLDTARQSVRAVPWLQLAADVWLTTRLLGLAWH